MSAKSHQSGTVVGQVQNNQSAPLRTVVNVSGEAITTILRHMARWMHYPEEAVRQINYIPSNEFANPRVNLSEYIALCKAVVTGEVKMLEEDLYVMGKESGYIKSKLGWEQFKAKYEIEWEERQRRQQVLVREPGNPSPPDDDKISNY